MRGTTVIRRLWAGRIAPVPAEFLGPQVSEPTRAFLTDVGLPTECPLPFTFYHDERLLSPERRAGREYLVFGDTYSILLVIEAGTSTPCELYPNAESPRERINSSLALFVCLLGIFCARLPDLRCGDVDKVRATVDELTIQIGRRDPQALADDDSWWNGLLYQAAEGYV